MNQKTTSAHSPNRNPFAPDKSRPVSVTTEQFEEAVVVDVIVNNEHPDYAPDGYNVGAVKFRLVNSNYYMADEYLSWAFAMDANISEYPLLNELVYIFRALNRYYYLKKINVSNRPTAQPMFGLNEEAQPVETGKNNNQNVKKAASSPIKEQTSVPALGKYFKDKSEIGRLKHVEGDTIFEGRSGQSIRFGTAWTDGVNENVMGKPFKSSVDQAPNLLLRVGPDPQAKRTTNSQFGLVIEDINKDASSIWMASNQIIPIKLATRNSKIHGLSVVEFPKTLEGNQIIINSSRVVMNAKSDKILAHSMKGIHLTTFQDITADADRDHITWTNRNRSDRVVEDWKQTVGGKMDVSVQKDTTLTTAGSFTVSGKVKVNFLGSKIYVGGQSEPLVLGKTLRDFLDALIDALTMDPILLFTGSPGSPSKQNPMRVAKLKQLKAQFLAGGLSAKILSQDNFTTRNNDEPLKERSISPYKEG